MADSPPITRSKPNLAEIAAQAKAQARLGSVVSARYRLTEVLALGGVGAVFKGEHIHMRKWVAVKVLHPDAQDAPDLVARFQREAVAGAHIQHPNVAAATDFGELEDGAFFLVLEYVRGVTLRELIKRGPLPVARAVHIARQVAGALAATHAIGIVHRDVTPRNLMVIEADHDLVKLIDFGLARVDTARLATGGPSRASESDVRITGTGAVFGTIAYLAPEVARGMELLDARADLYALGLVLYEMLAGQHPFDTTDAVELFKRHAATRPPPIAQRTPGVVVPPAVEAVVMRLLEKAPEARYSSGAAVIAALDAAMIDAAAMAATPTPSPVTISAPAPPSVEAAAIPLPPPPPAASGRARLAYAAVGLAALAVLGFSLRMARSSAPDHLTTEVASTVAVASVDGNAAVAPIAVSAVVAPIASALPVAPAPAVPPEAAAAPAIAAADPVTRGLLRSAIAAHDFKRAVEAFFTLVAHDPAAFHDPLLVAAARDLTVTIASVPGDDFDRVLDALATKLGSDGVDVLFEIVRTRGGSKAAARADALLARSEVSALGTPALQVTYALRAAPCADKLALLDRAVAGGDLRTLAVMETTVKACFSHSQALDDASKALRQRLSQRSSP